MSAMKTEQANVPKLRFPGFEREWETKVLDDICDLQAGNFVKAADIQSEKTEGSFRCYGGNGLRGYVKTKNRSGRFALVGRQGALCGNVHFVEGEFHATEHALVATAREEMDIDWIYYFLGRMNLNQYSTGLAQPGISAEVIKQVSSRAPALPEQQKIATFLGAVNTKIEQLSRKKALLEDYKRGVMQQIFSQQIRFKDDQGQDFPDWEEKRLEDVAKKISSNISAASLENSPSGSYPVYGASGVIAHVDRYQSNTPYIGVVKDGAGVGRLFQCPEKSSVLGTLEGVHPKDDNDIRFIYFWMSGINFAAYTTGSTIPHVYFKDYGKKRGNFPHLEEQRKIADFLTAIGAKINLVSQQLDSAKTFKRGLLQQMFV